MMNKGKTGAEFMILQIPLIIFRISVSFLKIAKDI